MPSPGDDAPQAPPTVAEPAAEPAVVAHGADDPVAAQPAGPRGGLSLVDVRRLWPDILEQTKNRRRLAWMVLSQHAHVVDVDGTRLTVGFANAGARDSFVNGGCDEILRQAAIDIVGMDWRVESIVDPGGAAAEQPVVRQAATDSAPSASPPTARPAETRADLSGGAPQDTPDGPPAWVTGGTAVPTQQPAPPAEPQVSAAPAREALEAARSGLTAPDRAEPVRNADDDVHPDDPDADSGAIDTEALLSQTLGARLIDEIKND